MAFLLRILAIAFLLWLAIAYIRNRLAGISRPSKPGKGGDHVAEMVKDPVCGSYVAIGEAVSLKKNGMDLYFCSNRCLKKYEGR
jgi:YHS domain-containing protein